ncbi:hypothetical protein SAMN03080606_00556 [Alkaliphilus peptidifermentans DSM 18978]|uniref:Uncharacterized protein n=2 Tax=Alkaliphilus TaxID=114627 RepID=A0A1G5BXR8_9FIRM|nr:hypothetical protein SAMN03080606_00556 [Alkaliphilus peptidifermentans DSM 18978]
MEAKKNEKKKRRKLRLVFSLIMVLLISGLIATDYATREMMAIVDGRVLGYTKNDNIHSFFLLGDVYDIDQKVMMDSIHNFLYQARVYFIKSSNWISKLIQNVG